MTGSMPFHSSQRDAALQAMDYALIGPRDNRVHVANTRRFPYNTICYLGRDFGDRRLRGCTGTLITPQTVLTAAHCIFSHRRGRAPLRIRVIPGRADRNTMPFGYIDSREYYVPQRYIRIRSSRDPARRYYDYGIIVLPHAFAKLKRFMPVRALTKIQLDRVRRHGQINVAGYPGDRPLGTLWRHSEYLKRISPRRLYYTVDTCPGHSGSPIWFFNRRIRQHQIIGVHTSGVVNERGRSYGCSRTTVLAPPGSMNSGVRITSGVLANIRAPRKRSGAKGPLVRLP